MENGYYICHLLNEDVFFASGSIPTKGWKNLPTETLQHVCLKVRSVPNHKRFPMKLYSLHKRLLSLKIHYIS